MAARLACPDSATAGRLAQPVAEHTPSLFNRPGFLRALHAEGMPRLRSYPSPRVWLAECGHPEDVLALTALLAEHGLLTRTQVFATAADPAHLARARTAAITSESLAACKGAYRAAGGKLGLTQFLEMREGEAGVMAPKGMVWAEHDLTGDASFNEFDLIVCARPMDSVAPHLQRRVLQLFADSLPLLGMLWISVAPGERAALSRFAALAPEISLYRRCL